MKQTAFENYLKEIHARHYEGLDDDMPDNFDYWLVGLEIDEVIKYADEWGVTLRRESQKELLEAQDEANDLAVDAYLEGRGHQHERSVR